MSTPEFILGVLLDEDAATTSRFRRIPEGYWSRHPHQLNTFRRVVSSHRAEEQSSFSTLYKYFTRHGHTDQVLFY